LPLALACLEAVPTLTEIRVWLERTRGAKASPSIIWRKFDFHDITWKMRPIDAAGIDAAKGLRLLHDAEAFAAASLSKFR